MKLIIDIGNTVAKLVAFEGDEPIEEVRTSSDDLAGLADFASKYKFEKGIVGSVKGLSEIAEQALRNLPFPILRFSPDTPVPVGNKYRTPETLGADRLAAAVGASVLKPKMDILIIDAGTCITIDFIDSTATYRGGAILPGIAMKFQALHTFTAKLPLLENIDAQSDILTGRSTHESILAGVLTATRLAVQGFVCRYRKAYGDIQVLLTGGDAEPLWGEGLLAIDNCTIHPWLVMNGLNEIINANEK